MGRNIFLSSILYFGTEFSQSTIHEKIIQAYVKAELLQEDIFFSLSIYLVMKKLEIEKTKPTFIISVLKIEY